MAADETSSAVFDRFRNAAEELAQSAARNEQVTDHGKLETGVSSGSEDVGDDTQSASEAGNDADALAGCFRELTRQAQSLTMIHEQRTNSDHGVAVVDKPISGVQTTLQEVIETARAKFYSYRLDRLPPVWRDVYADAHILRSYSQLLLWHPGDDLSKTLDDVVETLDRALIVAGKKAGSLGERWIEETIVILEAWEDEELSKHRPAKRARIEEEAPDTYSTEEPHIRPTLSPDHECPRDRSWTITKFEDYMNDPTTHPRPIIFTDLINDWPAMTSHPWSTRTTLLSQTFRGRRLVPIEIGRSYVDPGWGQELIPFHRFLSTYIDPLPNRAAAATASSSSIGYLAQHDLFHQLPSLRNDITIPDLCWASVPSHPTDPSANKPELPFPQLNAWFGPARTITPLHTDGYHNLLCQVVGTKYVRLYPPWIDRDIIRPRGEEMGVSMANTSELDVGVIEGWDEKSEELDQLELDAMRDDLKDVEYWECVLGPGDTLLIPMGWWHYVRSLSISFSVSFWWN